MAYAMKRELEMTYEEALEKIPAALKTEGFGILTEIDVKKTLKEKIDLDFRKYKILGACNPHLASEVLATDMDIGVLLPCNVVVWEKDDGKALVAAMDPVEAMKIAHNPAIEAAAGQVREKIVRALETL